jgi:hypothetical protein
MKMRVLGVKRIKGDKAKSSGNPYDICRLFGMVPVETFNKEGMSISGAGYEIAEISLDPEALPQFLGLTYPAALDLETDSKPFMGKFETIVVGYRPLQVKAA